jgi:putative colanic acid biosynthesis glycosyltransferase
MVFSDKTDVCTSKMPFFSIITVCLNDVVRLQKTLESLSAFYRDDRFEHLVIDGGSVDSTEALVNCYNKYSNFRYYSICDSGIYDAMNFGVRCCQSLSVLFLNCGDKIIVSPDHFCHSLHMYANENGNTSDVVCFPLNQIADTSVKTLTPKILGRHRMPTWHQGMIFSRKFIYENKYETVYKVAADYDVYLRAKNIQILGWDRCAPLVSVEAEGYASSNPVKSYGEYLLIASRRLKGVRKVITLSRIFVRAFVVVSIKTIFPTRWLSVLKSYFKL